MDALQTRVLHPIAKLLFPEEGSQFDGHHSFMVQYKPGEARPRTHTYCMHGLEENNDMICSEQDLGLDMHTDDSDVTYNLCLGKDFTGAGLTFCGMVGQSDHRQLSHIYKHVKGSCVVHLGRKRHGADDIQSGERRNLIIWNHSQAFRESHGYTDRSGYQKEEAPPTPECLSYTHDRDYGVFKEYPEQREKYRGHGWCPPEASTYDGFKAESTSCGLDP